jgi:hypothetical protein
MNLYVLKQIDFAGHWDETIAKAILAPSERRARLLANKDTGDEGEIWENATLVSCKRIDLNVEQIILTEFMGA